MPQFDKFSFFNQVFFILFLFFNFYFLISYYFLPNIAYNIKFRKKKIITNLKNKNIIHYEYQTILNNINISYKNFYSIFEKFLKKKSNIYFFKENKKIKNNFLINSFFLYKFNNFLNKNFFIFKKIFLSV
jgi:hypothetical protein